MQLRSAVQLFNIVTNYRQNGGGQWCNYLFLFMHINKIPIIYHIMPLSKTYEIKKHLNVIRDLFNNSYVYFNDFKLLSRNSNAGGVPDELVFMSRVTISLYIITILELAKILIDSRNHHFNIHKLFELIDELNNSSDGINLNLQVYKSQIENRLNYPIQKIQNLRDRAFAHTDKIVLNRNYSFNLTQVEIQNVLDFLKEFLTEVYPKVFLIPYNQPNLNDGAISAYNIIRNGV